MSMYCIVGFLLSYLTSDLLRRHPELVAPTQRTTDQSMDKFLRRQLRAFQGAFRSTGPRHRRREQGGDERFGQPVFVLLGGHPGDWPHPHQIFTHQSLEDHRSWRSFNQDRVAGRAGAEKDA
ncbi:MAG TPA: hypothetical protein VMS00_12110 [Acidimicrobiales bacterium]|nr:hypothetical protein [Acidimicrobiales bacterium]